MFFTLNGTTRALRREPKAGSFAGGFDTAVPLRVLSIKLEDAAVLQAE